MEMFILSSLFPQIKNGIMPTSSSKSIDGKWNHNFASSIAKIVTGFKWWVGLHTFGGGILEHILSSVMVIFTDHYPKATVIFI